MVAVMRTVPPMALVELMVSVFPNLVTLTLASELAKLKSESTPLLSLRVRVYFPSL